MMTDQRELSVVPQAVTQAITRAELDNQVTTARAFPRSIKAFQDACMSMATLNEKVADECYYALPSRGSGDGDDKPIEGPSVRLAEILVSAWGNCRAGARIIDEGAEFVVAQGVFQDMERNTHVTKDVRRRITTKFGKRYSSDMIAVTMNAAASIAFRNAVTAGVPRALWDEVYEAAKRTSVGSEKTLVAKRTAMVEFFGKSGVTQQQVCGVLGVKHVEDIDLGKLATLKGLVTAIRDGEATLEQVFPKPAPATAAGVDPAAATAKGPDGLASRMAQAKPAGESVATTTSAPVPAAAPAPTQAGREQAIERLVQGEQVLAASDAAPAPAAAPNSADPAFPLMPISGDTPVYLGLPTDEPKKAPVGALRWAGIEAGCLQWDGVQWRLVDESGAEQAYEHCVLACRKRLTNRLMCEGLSRGPQAMGVVKELLGLEAMPSSFATLTLDQLSTAIAKLGPAPNGKGKK